jgi:bacteriorhodopsin
MKKFFKVISGKKAWYVVLILQVIATVLEIVTAIRTEGYRIDYYGMGLVWVCLACWAVSIENREKKSAS